MELDEKKTKYFVIGIVLLILLGIVLIVHFNNKSLVSGDKDKETTTKKTTEVKTTEVTTTKKKSVVKQVSNSTEVVNSNVYKSVIDDENKIVYNYKLSNEILDTDKIISKKLDISEYLRSNSVIGLYDISLYSVDNIKKSVNNSIISVSIPLSSELIGYDEYKVIYINDNGVVTDEVFDTSVSDGYIKFTTTHLSMYGIVGIKNSVSEPVEDVVDLTNVKVSLSLNDSVIGNDRIIVSNNDIIKINVLNLDKEYKVYYALRSDDVNSVDTYNEYVDKIDVSMLEPTKRYTIIVKVVVGNTNAVFELNEVNSYDIVYTYDGKNEDTIGEIKDNDGNEIDYSNIDSNNDIAIKDVTNDDVTDEAIVNVKGNIYLVDKTDISNLNITGYLYIDTDKMISTEDKKSIDISNIYKVTILSNKFNLNGVEYEYEVTDDGSIIISKISNDIKEIIYTKPSVKEEVVSEETTVNEKEDTDVKFEDNFSGSNDIDISVDEDKNLVIVNKEKEVTEIKEPDEEKVLESVSELEIIGE